MTVSLVLQKLTDALLEMEEERAIWSAKEKASIEAIEHKAKLYDREIASFSRETSEVSSSSLVLIIKSFLLVSKIFSIALSRSYRIILNIVQECFGGFCV